MRLELYHHEDCPYSATIRDYIEEHDLKSQITIMTSTRMTRP